MMKNENMLTAYYRVSKLFFKGTYMWRVTDGVSGSAGCIQVHTPLFRIGWEGTMEYRLFRVYHATMFLIKTALKGVFQ